jgi:GNAT superfamily N-acetyltransferase
MLTAPFASYPRDLGNGLVLRWSTADDIEQIAHLVSYVFRDRAEDPLNMHMANSVRRQMRGDFPLMGVGDYAIVEDTQKEDHPPVACTCLWRQNWEYEGIPFSMGRPEFVATHPDYRNRGLIRALFEMIHTRSEAEGHLVQAITGIPYFYRQFGYEYALDLGGKRVTYLPLIPKLKEGEQESYTLREATSEDIPLIQQCYNQRRASSIVWTSVPDHYWHYYINAWKPNPEKDKTESIYMIVDNTGSARGYVYTHARRWGRDVNVWSIEVAPDVNWQVVMPSVLRALQALGAQMPLYKPDVEPLTQISFILGHSHPVYDVLGDALAPRYEPPYAWYVRVHDVPAFLRHIAPVLEKRLEHSVAPGYTGELKVDLYRSGLRMVFEQGRLTTAEHWKVPIYDSNAQAGFAPLLFLKLLFGHRSLNELRHAFPEVWANSEAEVILKALFPPRPSYVLPL